MDAQAYHNVSKEVKKVKIYSFHSCAHSPSHIDTYALLRHVGKIMVL